MPTARRRPKGTGDRKGLVHYSRLSAQSHDKVLRASRTIADLAGSVDNRPEHVAQAINYRMLDRQLWT